MTNFAQGIFRFRNLNKGTYMNILYASNIPNISNKTNDEINVLLLENEEKFNLNQKDGINFQIIKAIVRKSSKNYLESDLKPEFLLESPIDQSIIMNRMADNIINIDEILLNDEYNGTSIKTCINPKINTLVKKRNLAKLHELVFGLGNETAINVNTQRNINLTTEINTVVENNIQIIQDDSSLKEKLNKYQSSIHRIINHLNCDFCTNLICIKLFNGTNIKINDKNIYISYNILDKNIFTAELFSGEMYEVSGGDNNRICFVEFNDKILIELEDVAFGYYFNKLPIYDYLGNIMEQSLCNLGNALEYRYKLNIDEIFVRMLGIRNYIIRTRKTNVEHLITADVEHLITAAVNDITPIGLIILTYHILCCNTNRYNLSKQLIDAISKINVSMEEIIPKMKSHDISNFKNDLKTVCYVLNGEKQIAPLKLDTNGYAIDPPRLPYIMNSLISQGGFSQLNTHTKYLKKYLKYKKKYINQKH